MLKRLWAARARSWLVTCGSTVTLASVVLCLLWFTYSRGSMQT